MLVRFRYRTDQNTGGKGVVFDNISVTGAPLDGAETDTGWAFDGFSRMENGVGVTLKFNAYVAENRGYRSYDTSLKTAYNFGFLDSRPDWVESYAYQDGLLISYWDTSFTNNNVGDHPGGGLILPVDAHPTFHHAADGSPPPAADPELRLDVLEAEHQGDHGQHQQQADHDPSAEGR